MSTSRIVAYWILHLTLVFIIIKVFNLDLMGSFVALIGGTIIDVDHLPYIKKHSLSGYLYLRTTLKKHKRYILHNVFTIIICAALSLFILSAWSFYLGIFFISILAHLLLDIFLDLKVYNLDTEEWL